jgi:hypothetical protein
MKGEVLENHIGDGDIRITKSVRPLSKEDRRRRKEKREKEAKRKATK